MNLRSAFDRRSFLPFALSGAAVFVIALLMRAERHIFGLFGPHEYWASQWASDYAHGFVIRGLLGEILRVLSINDTDYAVLTGIAWIISLSIYFIMLKMLWRLLRERDFSMRLALGVGVLLSPAMSGILIETSGDPLQVLLLMHLALAYFMIERRAPPWLVGAAYAVAGAAMALVHEASIFLFIPWLGVQALLTKQTPQAMAAFIAAGATSAAVVAFVVLYGFSSGHNVSPVLHFGDAQFVYEGRLSPPFSVLLGEETHKMFGRGVPGYVDTILRLAGAALIPALAAFMLTAARLGTAGSARKLWRSHALVFAVTIAGLVPLLVIAHDWGRFFAYQLMLFIWIMATWSVGNHAPRYPTQLRLPIAGFLVIAGFTNTSILNAYRMNGLDASAHVLLVTVLFLVLFGLLTLMDRSPEGEGETLGPTT